MTKKAKRWRAGCSCQFDSNCANNHQKKQFIRHKEPIAMHPRHCRFFGANVKKWTSNQWNNRRRVRRKRPAFSPVMALGAVALMGSTLLFAEDAAVETPAF